MARGRMLNNKVSASKQFDSLPGDTCRLLATWTISHLDVRGVFYGDPALVKSYVFPRRADVTVDDVQGYLEAMAATKDGDGVPLVILFEARGETWQYWPKFAANQVGLRTDRETSDFPHPPDQEAQAARQEQDSGGTGEHDGGRDASESPESGGQDAGDIPAEVKVSEGNDQGKRREESGAAAPSPAGDPPSPTNEGPKGEEQAEPLQPATFAEWQALIRDTDNRAAALRSMFETLYPEHDPPDYSYIGKAAKLMGSGRLAELLWQNSTRPPTGDVLAYCMAIHKNRKGVSGNGSRVKLDDDHYAASGN